MAVVDSVALTAGHYISWGVISISVTNAVIIGVMLVVFVLALVLPFPQPHEARAQRQEQVRRDREQP